jgi:hypothetical protein
VDADAELDPPFGRQASVIPLWISIAQRTASTALRNSTIAPSPVCLTNRPWWRRWLDR